MPTVPMQLLDIADEDYLFSIWESNSLRISLAGKLLLALPHYDEVHDREAGGEGGHFNFNFSRQRQRHGLSCGA